MKINPRSVAAGFLLILALVGVVFFVKNRQRIYGPQVVSAPGEAFIKVRGPADAPVKIIEFTDFTCPSCGASQKSLNALFQDYPGKIQLTFKHFPLISSRWSPYAHQAAECMNRQGKFWPYQDLLYARQREWVPSGSAPVMLLARYAEELGADMNRFGACMADEHVARLIYSEKDEGNKRQISATPTFFIGEQRFVGSREMEQRGVDAVRQLLGLPPQPVAEEPLEPLVPPSLQGAAR